MVLGIRAHRTRARFVSLGTASSKHWTGQWTLEHLGLDGHGDGQRRHRRLDALMGNIRRTGQSRTFSAYITITLIITIIIGSLGGMVRLRFFKFCSAEFPEFRESTPEKGRMLCSLTSLFVLLKCAHSSPAIKECVVGLNEPP